MTLVVPGIVSISHVYLESCMWMWDEAVKVLSRQLGGGSRLSIVRGSLPSDAAFRSVSGSCVSSRAGNEGSLRFHNHGEDRLP